MIEQRGSARLLAVLGLGASLGIVAGGAFLLGRATARPRLPASAAQPEAASASSTAPGSATTLPSPAVSDGPLPSAKSKPDLRSLGDQRLDAQVRAVVASMDEKGRPPDGVAQGGRRDGARGVFDNAEGRLPRRSRGYYRETDVWARGSEGRGAERLIFGKDGEVYYTPDHYRTFKRIR
jgi:guanyl-specific ribonuclease Sa